MNAQLMWEESQIPVRGNLQNEKKCKKNLD